MLGKVAAIVSAIILSSYIYLILTANNPLFENAIPINTSKVSNIQISQEVEKQLLELGLTPRDSIQVENSKGEKQLIHGRFLHITDMHPDEFYKTGSKIDEACHRGKGKTKKGNVDNEASKYGDAIKGCDSPVRLVENTLEWISINLKDKIDFVVWTGDNIRHDNDRKVPRLETNIFEMNEKMADLMHETFLDDNGEERVKVVPSLGNNDVYPHNLFAPGPTLQTRELYKIWKNFVPSEQLHVFARGAYFFSEIIPNKLAVLSINTLYLFRSNPLVDNCDRKKEPGYKLFEWLGYTLKELRARGMKVWLTGHVPPTPKNYDATCLRKHIVWLYEYRDIIIGSLYGHMNIDHFIPLDSQKAYKSINKNLKTMGLDSPNLFDIPGYDNISVDDIEDDDDDFEDLEAMNAYLNVIADDEIFGSEPHVMAGAPLGKVEYMDSIRDAFYSRVKGLKKRGVNSERYSIAHITVSVVPTFNPGIRVWEYNITGLFDEKEVFEEHEPWSDFFNRLDSELFAEEDGAQVVDELDYDSEFMTQEKLVEILKTDKTFPPKMPPGTPLGPAYEPQAFTPQRYVQYYADLEKLNAKADKNEDVDFKFEVEYATDDSFYKLDTLVVDEWIKFSRKLGEPVKNQRKSKAPGKGKFIDAAKENKLEKLWKKYLTRSFIDTGYEDMAEYQ